MRFPNVKHRNLCVLSLTFLVSFLLLLPLLSLISQSSVKTENELYHLKHCFYEMLERDLTSNDRLNSRIHYVNYYPSHMLASFLSHINSPYQVHTNNADDKVKIHKILTHHKLFRQRCFKNPTRDNVSIKTKLLKIEDPVYDKGWNQYRLFLDVLKSSVRAQIILEDGLFQKVNIPFLSASNYYRDYFIVKYLSIDDLRYTHYHKDIFNAHLSSYALIKVGSNKTDTRNNIFINSRISHSRLTDNITLYVDLLTPERSLQKSFELQDMEEFIAESYLEYSPLCRK